MASGDTLRVFHPLAIDSQIGTVANWAFVMSSYRPYLVFDPDTDEQAIWSSILPRHYNGGGITVYIHQMSETVSSGNVVWQAAFERQIDNSNYVNIDNFASYQSSGAVAVPSLTRRTNRASVAFTDGAQIDSLVVGDMFRFRLNRDANNASDTAAGLVGAMMVELKET